MSFLTNNNTNTAGLKTSTFNASSQANNNSNNASNPFGTNTTTTSGGNTVGFGLTNNTTTPTISFAGLGNNNINNTSTNSTAGNSFVGFGNTNYNNNTNTVSLAVNNPMNSFSGFGNATNNISSTSLPTQQQQQQQPTNSFIGFGNTSLSGFKTNSSGFSLTSPKTVLNFGNSNNSNNNMFNTSNNSMINMNNNISVGKIARYIEKLQLSYSPYQNAQGNTHNLIMTTIICVISYYMSTTKSYIYMYNIYILL